MRPGPPAADELVLGRPSPVRTRTRRRVARRVLAALLAAVLVVVLLLVVVVLTARGWRAPEPVPALGARPLPVVPAWEQHLPYAAVDRVRTGGSEAGSATGSLVRPRGAPDGLPAVVLVGDGSGRDDLPAAAETLARGGVVALVPGPGGCSLLCRDVDARARDALAARDLLADQPGVDPDRVGLLGVGSGGWVATAAADRSGGRVAFLLLVSTPGLSPVEQAAWAADRRLRDAPDPVRRAAAALVVVAARFVGAPTSPAAAPVGVPVRAVWGAADRSVPVAEGARRLRAAAGDRGSVEVVPGAGHAVPVAAGWAGRGADWVRRSTPADPVVRGTEPDVLTGPVTLPETGPPGDPRLLLGAALVAALVGGLVGGRRRPR